MDISRPAIEPVHPNRVEWPSRSSAWRGVALLMAALFMSYIDRSILGLLVEPVKASLHLSDTQIGLVQGPAFGIFLTLVVFPAGWMVDRMNRLRLVAAGLALWSTMTALTGFCTNFGQLVLMRMGVAVGEATLTPAAPSLIVDEFPPNSRSLPISIYALGGASGAGAALIAGGSIATIAGSSDTITLPWIGSVESWRAIFVVLGCAGLLLVPLLLWKREPARRGETGEEGSLRDLVAHLSANRATIVPLFVGVTLYQIQAAALLAWIPAFFMRVHGWTMAEVGLRYGIIHLAFGIAGAVVGGAVPTWLRRSGRRANANLQTASVAVAGMTIPAMTATLVPSGMVAALLLGLFMGCAQASGGVTIAGLQELAPNRLRGKFTALFYATVGLGALAVGPLLVGILNDRAFASHAGIGTSLALTGLLTLPASAVLIWRAAVRHGCSSAGLQADDVS